MATLTREVDCPSFFDHTPSPSGYNQWHDWAKRMSRTHRQIRCTDCGLYAIWMPRRAANQPEGEAGE
jgi:hypothetical protein